jgi:hypothetical protein
MEKGISVLFYLCDKNNIGTNYQLALIKMDKLALNILLKDYKHYQFELRTSTPEKFEYAKSKGLMFDDIVMTHDQADAWMFESLYDITMEKAVNLFLASLSTRRLDWRSGLSAFAVSRVYPNHTFTPDSDFSYMCSICGDYCYEEKVVRNLNLINCYRLATGGMGLIGKDPFTLAFYLDQFARLEDVKPNKLDEDIFWEIISVIETTTSSEWADDLEKKLSKAKLIKSNTTERREILETLAHCGILETQDHQGYRKEYITTWIREQRKWNRDWGYPLRWWQGKDGINNEALYFWFGKR